MQAAAAVTAVKMASALILQQPDSLCPLSLRAPPLPSPAWGKGQQLE